MPELVFKILRWVLAYAIWRFVIRPILTFIFTLAGIAIVAFSLFHFGIFAL